VTQYVGEFYEQIAKEIVPGLDFIVDFHGFIQTLGIKAGVSYVILRRFVKGSMNTKWSKDVTL